MNKKRIDRYNTIDAQEKKCIEISGKLTAARIAGNHILAEILLDDLKSANKTLADLRTA